MQSEVDCTYDPAMPGGKAWYHRVHCQGCKEDGMIQVRLMGREELANIATFMRHSIAASAHQVSSKSKA